MNGVGLKCLLYILGTVLTMMMIETRENQIGYKLGETSFGMFCGFWVEMCYLSVQGK